MLATQHQLPYRQKHFPLSCLVFVVLLLFGGKKIPELMRGLGSGIREFNNAKNSINNEIREGMREAERKELPENK